MTTIGAPSLGALVLAAAVVFGAGLVGAFAYNQIDHRNVILNEADRELQGVANVLSEHMARMFEESELALHSVARLRADAEATGLGMPEIHRRLKAIQAVMPVFRSLVWVDSNGDRIASSYFADPPPLNIRDAGHFSGPRDLPDYADRLYIGAPRLSDLLKSWIVVFSRRIGEADGAFAGVAAGVVDAASLANVYRSANLGDGGVVRLIRHDGVVLVQEPFDAAVLGAPAPAPAASDDWIVKTAVVSGHDAQVEVSKNVEVALRGFRRSFYREAGVLVVVLAALGFVTSFLLRQIRRLDAADRRLRSRYSQFRDFAHSSGDWFWELGADLRYVWVSESVSRVAGRPAASFIGKRPEDMVPPQDRTPDLLEHWARLASHRPFRDLEYRRSGPDGDRWFSASGVPVFDDQGAFQGFRGSARDVTEQRRAERALQDAVAVFPGRFMMFDAEERLVFANDSVGSPIKDVARHLILGETIEAMLRRLVAAGLMDDAKDDPEGWIALRLAKFRAADGKSQIRVQGRTIECIETRTQDGGVISLRFDVTERERAFQEAQDARALADKANLAKSEFLARMSHELRTPLNAVIGFGQMLELDHSRTLTDDQKEYAEHIVKSGQHLLNLVTEVLDLAGVEAGKLRLAIERLDAGKVVEQIVRTMRPVADKAGVDLSFRPGDARLDVRADAQRLRQVLLNLASNAIKYNRAGGTVSLEVVAVGAVVRISVRDTGMGIDAARAAEVFTPFNRLGAEHGAIEGVGIGLSLSKRLVEAMDGAIGFESEADVGSTFWVDLPLAVETPAARDADRADDEALTAVGGYSLLYVEDNPANLRLMEHLVGALPDVTMHAAPSGALGLELARAQRPDIIVLDLNLPGMSGYEVLKRLKASPETWSTPVIALTAAAMPSDVQQGLAAGFYRYVTKPLDVKAFLAAVQEALASRHSRADDHDEAADRDAAAG